MGRKKKEVFESIEDALDDAIATYMQGKPLTLEQTAVALWHIEGRKKPKPMTAMGILKIEKVALEKLRRKLSKYGIKETDDVFETRGRKSLVNKMFDGIDEN